MHDQITALCGCLGVIVLGMVVAAIAYGNLIHRIRSVQLASRYLWILDIMRELGYRFNVKEKYFENMDYRVSWEQIERNLQSYRIDELRSLVVRYRVYK